VNDVAVQAPSTTQTRRILADGLGVAVEDFRCRANVHPKGPEEANLRHSIVFIRRGIFIRQRGRESVVADANQILFFNASEPYHIAHPAAGGDDCTILSVPADLVLDMLERHMPRHAGRLEAPFPFGSTVRQPWVTRLQFELLRRIRCPMDPAIDEVLLEAIETAVRCSCAMQAGVPDSGHAIPARTARRRRDLAAAAQVVINSSLGNPPSLTHLARILECSPFHLSRVFRSQVGLSLRAYIARLRVHLAAERLARGERDLTALALDLGYTDHSHFTHSFRREWGAPPSVVRTRYGRFPRRPTSQTKVHRV
jgi:AraC-like DNA-binding protein